ncbi:hypothetical protein SAMN05660216_01941 [Pseudomonas sp. LAMO17WK12:I8]|nr:hypothetical protein SAMN05660216_01941 [Pseudomonas sp. LAMO17WK12:I8]SNY18302.1 hypothetical protein SAMN05660893_01753 [Pseudomonas sp. LAMO17WK12:I12]SNY19416.1 hypothetical protein SAMN05660344_01944 [Pseudomonas sp. LAMO17WK12:I11]SNY19439.1 hypothetical protein SAMN05660700_01944 [Pseudomonas sp. LAMO17WK12:I7]
MDNYHLSRTADGWELKKTGAERAASVPLRSRS